MMMEGIVLQVIGYAAEPSLFLVNKLYFDGAHTLDWRSDPYLPFYIQRRTQHALNHLLFMNRMRVFTVTTMLDLENTPMTNAVGELFRRLEFDSDDEYMNNVSD